MKAKKSRYKSARPAPRPSVDLSQPLPILADRIGRILKAKHAPLYRMGSKLVTVNRRGKVVEMTPERFARWIGKYVTFTSPGMDAGAAKTAAAEQIFPALVLLS